METLGYSESGEVATVTLLRPTVNVRMVKELLDVCDQLEDDSEAKFVVFRGVDGVFCRGIDYQDFDPDGPMDIHGFHQWEKATVRIERLPKAIVVLLEGEVLGAGVQLALAADARVAVRGTTLQLDEVHAGFLPGMATFRLAKYVGLGRAKRLVMRAERIDADEAVRLGIVDEVTDDAEATLASVVASFGPVNPVAVQLARRLLNESYSFPYEDAIGHFLAAQHRAIGETAFLDTVRKRRGE